MKEERKFFGLESAGTSEALVQSLNFRIGGPKCAMCGKIIRCDFVEPLRVSVFGSSNLKNCIWPITSGLIVPKDVKDLFEDHSITGVRFSRVDIEEYSIDNREYASEAFPENKLYHTDILGHGGVIPTSIFSWSARRRIHKCKICGNWDIPREVLWSLENRNVFSLAEWDGTDCFFVSYTGPFFSNKVVSMLNQNGIVNWKAIPVKCID